MARLAAKQEAPGNLHGARPRACDAGHSEHNFAADDATLRDRQERPVPAFFASAFAQEHAESKAWRHEQSHFDGRAAMGTVETPEAYGAPPRKIASIWPPARRGPPYAPLAASRSSRIIGAGESGFTVLESFAGRLQRRGLVLIKLNIIRG